MVPGASINMTLLAEGEATLESVTNCHRLKLPAADGKKRPTTTRREITERFLEIASGKERSQSVTNCNRLKLLEADIRGLM